MMDREAGSEAEPRTIEELLFQEPYRFDFHQAVRLLDQFAADASLLSPGEGNDPAKETIRFRSANDTEFPASQLGKLEVPVDGRAPELTVRFLGLLGVQGPLPLPITELAQRATLSGDTALRDFLDLFHHRLLSLVRAVRARHRVGGESGDPDKHHFAGHLRALMGMATPGLGGRMRVPDKALLRGAGLLADRTRSVAGLESLLTRFLGVRARVTSFSGAWAALDPEECTTIGIGGRNHVLGQTATVGSRVWDQSARVHIEVGPLTVAQYANFLPGRKSHVALCEMARFYLGTSPDFELALVLHKDEVPEVPLGDGQSRGPLLGWTSFLSCQRARPTHVTIPVSAAPAGPAT